MVKTATLFILSLAFCFGCFEATARFFLVPLYEAKVALIQPKDLEWGAKHLPLAAKDRIQGGFIGKVPHPYFGFSNFESSFERPEYYYGEPKKKYRVGIFGGSVAEQIGQANQASGAINKFIEDRYKFADNDVDVVNFAAGGYRQPQSYYISTIYGEHLQLAISIEGVNELADFVLDLPPYFPMGFVSNLYFRSLEEMAQVPELHRRALLESYLRETLSRGGFHLSSVKLYYLVRRFLNLKHMTPIQDAVGKIKYRFYKNVEWDNTSMSRKLAMWLKFSCLQQNVMQDFGVTNFFVVQPVPQNFKPLTEAEKSFVKGSRVGEVEIAQYMARIDFRAFQAAGLNLIDMRKVFSTHEETLYSDSCCHFTAHGDDLFLSLVLAEVAKQMDRPPRHCDLQKLSGLIER